MGVEVFSRLIKRLPRRVGQLSVAGDSLPVRLRSTTIGLVGLAAAVGLGLVAMISQQGWPDPINAPFPQAPRLGVVRNDPLALPPASQPSPRSGRDHSRVAKTHSPPSSPTVAAVDTHLDGARQLEGPASEPTPAPEAPESPPESQGQGSPSPSTAAAEPTGIGTSASTGRPPANEGPGPVTAGEPEAPPEEPERLPEEPELPPEESSHGNGPPPWAGGGRGPSSEYPHRRGKPSWAGH